MGRFGDDTNPQRYDYNTLHGIAEYSDADPVIRYITHNEDWCISRSEDSDFVTFYLHDTVFIHREDISRICDYTSFAGIGFNPEYACMYIRLLRRELMGK